MNQYKGIYTQLPKTKSMNTEITDEMVKGFLKTEVFFRVSEEQVLERWDKFKASHSQPEGVVKEKDWEILSVKNQNTEEITSDSEDIDAFLKGFNTGWHIHSVRRLSDGEVFSIGDEIEIVHGIRKIEKITIERGFLTIYHNSGMLDNHPEYGIFKDIKKAPEVKEPLFTTEDGVDMFGGDRFWLTNEDFKIFESSTRTDESPDCYKTETPKFSTKQAAETHVLMNRPCLSIQNVLDWNLNDESPKELIELVKSKLTGGDK